MSAVAREIVYALNAHPSAKLPKAQAHVLLSADESDAHDSFIDSFGGILDEHSAAVAITPKALAQFAADEVNADAFDVVILSNVLNGAGAIGNAQKISDILEPLLVVLRSGGVAIIRENFEGRGAQILADMTKFLDVYAAAHKTKAGVTKVFGFDFYAMNQLQDSIYSKSNFLDVFWTLTKSVGEAATPSLIGAAGSSEDGGEAKLRTYREFLDRTQYTEDNVRSYEWIFGDNFISPGGVDENRRILKYFRKLVPGQRMLDIGVGLGGGARQAAKEFGVRVLGCDLSSNMILHAFERLQRDKDHRVEYQIADATVYAHAANSFDAVFSRDCIQHIQDTDQLFANIFKWLKPGGEFLVTMYGQGYGELQPKFLEYVSQRQYCLQNLKQLVQSAKEIGFVNIYTENMTPRLEEILRAEHRRAVENKEEFVEKFGEKLFDMHVKSWSDKLQFIRDDNQNWLLLRAEKPLAAPAEKSE